MLDKKPHCPIVYHFGDQDASIPLNDIEKIKNANPKSTVYVYAGAGHGFNCDERAQLQREGCQGRFRTLDRVLERADLSERRALSPTLKIAIGVKGLHFLAWGCDEAMP